MSLTTCYVPLNLWQANLSSEQHPSKLPPAKHRAVPQRSFHRLFFVACIAASCIYESTSASVDGSKNSAGRVSLPGVYRATYKDPRPQRLTNFPPAETASPTSNRLTRQSPSLATPLVVRLLQEQAATDASQSVVHTVHQNVGAYKPQSYQQYEVEAASEGHSEEEGHVEEEDHHEPGRPYEFVYQVSNKDADGADGDYGHAESSDGHKTWGRYFVHQPDGRVKTVKYWADKTGYHADVEYHGEAHYPDSKTQLSEAHGESNVQQSYH